MPKRYGKQRTLIARAMKRMRQEFIAISLKVDGEPLPAQTTRSTSLSSHIRVTDKN